jgi:hypothetical protein
MVSGLASVPAIAGVGLSRLPTAGREPGTGGTPRIGRAETSELLIRAEPDSYVFYCSIQSHHQAGMEGTIIVE